MSKRKQCDECSFQQNEHFVYNCTRSKKPKLVEGLPPNTRSYFWVSATDTRNYLNRDPLVDWLKFSKKRNKNKIDNKKYNEFFEFILNRGNEFEQKLVDYINKHKLPVVTVSNKITNSSCLRTIELMRQGIPIIHSAPLKNKHKHIRGIADFLVRSDHLGELVDENPLTDLEQTAKASNLNGNYHYVVIDVKFSTLPLRADGRHLLNSGSYPAYKSQAWIYTTLVSDIQGYTSPYAFILGRRWSYTSRGEKFSGLNCLDKLGVINYITVDSEFPQRTEDAMLWLKDVHKYGKTWTVYPPSREELYPNMCVDSGEWNSEKKEIADKIGEITSIWYVGNKHRSNALELGIDSWRDPQCTSQSIGIGGVRAPIIDKIMDINRQTVDKIRPNKIKTRMYDWNKEENEIFVDFETFADIFAPLESLPVQSKTDCIFMIGVYYKDEDNKDNKDWKYTNFIAKSPSVNEEYRIMNEFVQFKTKLNNPKIWYWHAENSIWSRAENRVMDNVIEVEMNDEKSENILNNWIFDSGCDLAKVFRQEPIVLKNCFKFSLKEVSSVMREHGMIKARIESDCDSGLSASVKAWKAYQTCDDPVNSPIMKDIAVYNKFDVEVLYEILMYLRKNHL